jgi:hypothetical protein
MIKAKAILYPRKIIGDLPGIDVGHRFFSRAEMCAVGFHNHWLNGIDYMSMEYEKVIQLVFLLLYLIPKYKIFRFIFHLFTHKSDFFLPTIGV